MTKKRVTWHLKKAESNIRDHEGVTFEEAGTVLDDPLAYWERDWEHGEQRLSVTGHSNYGRVLFVVTLEIDEDEFRIISARKASRHERKRYEGG